MAKTAPQDLGKRGKALWRSLKLDLDTPAGALAYEAAKIVDRLVSLHERAGMDGAGHVGSAAEVVYRLSEVLETDDVRELTITVEAGPVLNEIRQQQTVLRQTLTSLEKFVAAEDEGGGGEPDGPRVGKVVSSTVDEFTARRNSRGTA